MKIRLLTIISLAIAVLPGIAQPKGYTLRELQEKEKKGEVVRLNQGIKPQNPLVREVSKKGFSVSSDFEQARINASVLNTRSSDVPTAEDLYGYLFYTKDREKTPYGLYNLEGPNRILQWPGVYITPTVMFTPLNGWYDNGKLCGVSMDADFFYIYDYFYYELDFNTGEILSINSLKLQQNMFYRCIINPNDNKVYGYIQDIQNSRYYWGLADMSTPTNVTLLNPANDDYCYSICYNSSDENFYGVNIKQQFVRISPEGRQTVLCQFPNSETMATYATGLAWCPADGVFYWNCTLWDDTSYLYSITPEGNWGIVGQYPYNELFTFFLTTEGTILPDRPLPPLATNSSFENNSLTGTVTYKIPEKYGNGQALPSELTYSAVLNGEDWKQGTVAPGEFLNVEYTVPSRGMYTFGLYVSAGDAMSPIGTIETYVGDDTPVAPENIVLTSDRISWKAVTKGEFNGYLDLSKMMYKVYINGEYKGETSETSYSLEFDPEVLVNDYVGSVVAVCNGYEGEPGYSNKLIEGMPYSLPAYFVPTQDEYDTMTIVDANNDGTSWAYNVWDMVVNTMYSEDGPMDDYLFLPPINFEKGDAYYKFSCEAALCTPAYPDEFMQVVYATAPTPSAVKGVIIEKYQPEVQYVQAEWNNPTAYWKLPEAGTYYIGIRCISSELQLGFYARNFRIETSDMVEESPAAVEDLNAVAGSKGALNATVSFVFPVNKFNGEPIESTTLLAKIYANGVEKAQVSGAPGSEATKLITTEQGYNRIEVVVYEGDLVSPDAWVKVYTGYTPPAAPTDLEYVINPDMYSAVITWEKVTEPSNPDGFIDPEDVTYTVWQSKISDDILQLPYWDAVATNISGTSYTFTLPEGSPQDFYDIGVSSQNVAGSTDQFNYVTILMGKPYQLPFYGVVSQNGFTTDPWFSYSRIEGEVYNGAWSTGILGNLIPEFAGNQTYVAVGYPRSVPGKGDLLMPRFTTSGVKEATLAMKVLTGPETPDVRIVAEVYGADDLIPVGVIKGNQGNTPEMKTFSFNLPERLLSQGWVQIYILVQYTSINDLFVMENLSVVGGNTGVDRVEDYSSIRSGKGFIECKGYQGEKIVITDSQGRIIVKTIQKEETGRYDVAKGLYIVKAGTTNRKVMVF